MATYLLKDVCTLITDGSHFSPVDCENGYPMFSVKDMCENGFSYADCKHISEGDFKTLVRNGCKPLQGDVLLAKDGSYLKTAFVVEEEKDIAVLSSIAILRPNQEMLDAHFLSWFLKSESVYRTVSLNYISGTALKRIILKGIGKIQIPLPDLPTQRHIAATLDKVSEGIAVCRQMLADLDVLVKSQFVEMFGDIIENTKQWPIYRLEEIASSRLGKMLDAKKQTGEFQFPYLANTNVQWFRFDLNELRQMDFAPEDQVEFELQDGDLMVCEGGEVGRCAVWHNEITPCFFQKAIHRVRCKSEYILPEYLAFWFKHRSDFNAFEDVVGSVTTIAHLPGVKLKNMNVVVPPIDLQRQFVALLAQADKSKFVVQQQLAELETLKKSLMQEYFG